MISLNRNISKTNPYRLMPIVAAIGTIWIRIIGHLHRNILEMIRIAVAPISVYIAFNMDAYHHKRGHGLSEQRKSVLICPECKTESLVNGDWIVVEHKPIGRRPVYECPECGTIINPRYTDW